MVRFDYTLHWDAEGQRRPRTEPIVLEPLDTSDYLQQILQSRRTFYERDLLEHIAYRGPRGDVFIDVGANVGNHSVYFGKFLADHVICVEASRELIPVLQRNLQANGVTNSIVFHCGVGARAASGYAYRPSGFEHNAGHTQVCIADENTAPEGRHAPIPIRTLDDIVSEARPATGGRPVKFVKIDVEGMELDVLRGATELLRGDHPQLAVELATAAEFTQVQELLAQFGYRAVGRFCATPTYHFIDPSVHNLRKGPSRLAYSWYLGRLHRMRTRLLGRSA